VAPDVEGAVRRVLPALNFDPASFEFDRGFPARARRRAKPSVLVVNDLANQLVFVGTIPTTDPDAVVERVAGKGLTALSDSSRRACERLMVAWEDPDRGAFAAAFSVTPDGGVGQLLGSSWHPPESWPDPMIDVSKSHDQVMDEAMLRLASVVKDRRATPDFDATLDRALRLIYLALTRLGGEGQHASDHPSARASDAVWSSWLDRYQHSVHDEWRRVGGVGHRERIGVKQPTAQGPLSGMRVFLSYARPDSTALARPVYEALRSYGAYVWFDQEEPLEKTWLDVGLAERIGECDAYVMCASDEFIERAGYATQEVAWAAQQGKAGVRTRYFLIVARPDTVLPSIVADWPMIELKGQDLDNLARALAAYLQAPLTLTPAVPLPGPTPAHIQPPLLPRDADIAVMRSRVAHVRRYFEIDQASFQAVADEIGDTRHTAEVRALLRRVGEGLDWQGALSDLDRWPEDPLIRDYRWRLGCMRSVAGTRWPLSGNLHEHDDIADDIEYIATRPIPVMAWAPVPGWDDNERRLTLRWHAGLLRGLQQLLSRGLIGGLFAVPSSTLDEWEAELLTRRRECGDALVNMRLQGLLSWRGDPPTWDQLFRRWSELVVADNGSWSQPVPAEVQLAFAANNDDVAAVAAQTTWYAAHYGGLALQSFTLRNFLLPTSIDVWAAGLAGTEPEPTEGTGQRLQLGLMANADGSAAVRLSWSGFDVGPTADPAAGSTSMVAPEKLGQAISFRRA
jgi:TIR domain